MAFNLSNKHPFITLHMYVCNLLSQYFWKYTVFKKALNFRNHIIPKFKIRQNPFYKNVSAVPHNKVTVLSIYNVKLCLNLVVVVMTLVCLQEAVSRIFRVVLLWAFLPQLQWKKELPLHENMILTVCE